MIKKILPFLVTIILVSGLSSCYYDNMAELNPSDATCDTSKTITYSGDISKILSDNCTSCHSGSAPSGNINLSDYNSVKTTASSGKLYSSLVWDGTASPMPKGSGSKISDCSITKIKLWIQTNYAQ